MVLEAARLLGGNVVGVIEIDTLQRLGSPATDEQIEQFMAPGSTDFPAFVERYMSSLFAPGTDSALVARYTHLVSQVSPSVGLSALENTLREDPRPVVQDLSVPVRLIVSPRVPVDEETWRTAVGDFSYEVMEGVGHFPMLTAPERFGARLRVEVDGLTSG